MKSTEVLTQLKTLLGMEVKLEEMELSNGTILEAEKFEAGQEVFIKTEDEKVALPEGIYDLADGNKLIVVDEGVIDDIKSEIETDMSEEIENQVEETVLEENQEEKQEMNYATKEELAEVKEMIEEIKAMIEPKEEEMSSEEPKEEIQAEQQELKEELSKPAAEAIKHNPEAQTKTSMNLYAQSRATTTFDRVLEKISNINR